MPDLTAGDAQATFWYMLFGLKASSSTRSPEEENPHPALAPPPVAHRGVTIWLTGLSGSGKSTIADAACCELIRLGLRAQVLDGDWVRAHLSPQLGFSRMDRDENIRRVGIVAELLTRNDVIVLVAAISPYRTARDQVRSRISSYFEVHVHAPLEVCEQRDPKGLYRKARAGQIQSFTGVDDPYEAPLAPELRLETHAETVNVSVDKLLSFIHSCLAQR